MIAGLLLVGNGQDTIENVVKIVDDQVEEVKEVKMEEKVVDEPAPKPEKKVSGKPVEKPVEEPKKKVVKKEPKKEPKKQEKPKVDEEGTAKAPKKVSPKPIAEEKTEPQPKPKEDPVESTTMEVTQYTAGVESTDKSPGDSGYGITASGAQVQEGVTIACPSSIPFGTEIDIEGIGTRVCQDRGGLITEGKLDIYVDDLDQALDFGRKTLEVTIK